jgi:hypothetical protein
MRRAATSVSFEIGDDGTERVAVIGVAVQGPGAQHELPALGRGDRGDNRDLAAELVGRAGLAFADALHLGGVQRVRLWARVGVAYQSAFNFDPALEWAPRAGQGQAADSTVCRVCLILESRGAEIAER